MFFALWTLKLLYYGVESALFQLLGCQQRVLNTSTRMITCLAARMVINWSLQNLICHILKASTFGAHHRSGDIGSVLPAGLGEECWLTVTTVYTADLYSNQWPVDASSSYWRGGGAGHLTNVPGKYNIYSFSSTALQRFWLFSCCSSHSAQELACSVQGFFF